MIDGRWGGDNGALEPSTSRSREPPSSAIEDRILLPRVTVLPRRIGLVSVWELLPLDEIVMVWEVRSDEPLLGDIVLFAFDPLSSLVRGVAGVKEEEDMEATTPMKDGLLLRDTGEVFTPAVFSPPINTYVVEGVEETVN